jgi:hypothetical protein
MWIRKYKGYHFNADGYDPRQMAAFISKHIYNGKVTQNELQDAYAKVMTWIEMKKLPFSEKTISDNKDEITVAINDPDFFEKGEKVRPNIKAAFIVIGIILLLYYFLFEFNQNGVHQVEQPAAQQPVPPAPVPLPAPVPPPVSVPPIPTPTT